MLTFSWSSTRYSDIKEISIQNHLGQSNCNKGRDEENDPNSEELPDKKNHPDAGLPKNPKDFKPVIPKWPTPTGKKKEDVKIHCDKKIKESDTYKSCHRVLGGRFSIKGAVEQCMADTLVRSIHIFNDGNDHSFGFAMKFLM